MLLLLWKYCAEQNFSNDLIKENIIGTKAKSADEDVLQSFLRVIFISG